MTHTNDGGSRNKCVIEGVEVVPKGVDITPKGVMVTPKEINPAHIMPQVDPSGFGVDQEGVKVTIEGDGFVIGG